MLLIALDIKIKLIQFFSINAEKHIFYKAEKNVALILLLFRFIVIT